MHQTDSHTHNSYTPAFNPILHADRFSRTSPASSPSPANRPQIFQHPAFGQLRAVRDETTGQPLFVARDVALVLGYKRPDNAMTLHCKHRRKVKMGYSSKQGGTPFLTLIPESDLYRLIIASKLPAAQKFADWVFEEVLPSLNKHGLYATPETAEAMLNDPDAMILLLQTIKDERQKAAALQAQVDSLEKFSEVARRNVRKLQDKVEQDQPKVAFAEALEASPACISIAQLAKLINQATGREVTGRDRLFAWLRAKGWLMSAPGRDYNKPTQKAVSRGYLESKTYLVKDVMGNATAVNHTPVITGKGQRYFIGLFRLSALERRNPH